MTQSANSLILRLCYVNKNYARVGATDGPHADGRETPSNRSRLK